jgi:magnesium transporter
MMTSATPPARSATNGHDYKLYFFSTLLGGDVCETRADFRIGKLTDLVFRLSEPYPEAVGIFISHGWGKPTEFIAWERVSRIEGGTIFVLPPESGDRYPPFVDQPGWILLNEHLMGKEILDMDDRQVQIVNDVQLLESHGRMIVAHVDSSFNGFLRKWGIDWLAHQKDQFISWKHVQPLSIEDVTSGKKVSLSVTRTQIHELPSEDLADALEELSGREQEAVFSVLDSEKAAETLLEVEPRAQRQLVEDLSPERAREILSEMSVAQVAELLEALPLDDRNAMIALLPPDDAARTREILSQHEAKASSLMFDAFVALPQAMTAKDAIARVRESKVDRRVVHYVYVVQEPDNLLLGAVDIRDLVLSDETALLGDLMSAPAVSVEQDLTEKDVEEMFAKYHYRMFPVVDASDHLLGVVHYKDIGK